MLFHFIWRNQANGSLQAFSGEAVCHGELRLAGKKEKNGQKSYCNDRIPAMVISHHNINKDDCACTRISNSGIEAETK